MAERPFPPLLAMLIGRDGYRIARRYPFGNYTLSKDGRAIAGGSLMQLASMLRRRSFIRDYGMQNGR